MVVVAVAVAVAMTVTMAAQQMIDAHVGGQGEHAARDARSNKAVLLFRHRGGVISGYGGCERRLGRQDGGVAGGCARALASSHRA